MFNPMSHYNVYSILSVYWEVREKSVAAAGTKIRSGSASPASSRACLSSLGPLAPLPLSQEARFPVGGAFGRGSEIVRGVLLPCFMTCGSLFFSLVI